MKRRTRKPRLGITSLLVVSIAAMVYLGLAVVPTVPPPFVPTPTQTRSPESFTNQAEEYYKQGKLKPAMEAYEQAILADPGNPANFVALARLQVFSARYDEAVENAQNALLSNPNNPVAHAVLGWALGLKGDYGQAELELKKAIELDPNNALAHAYYAEILMYQDTGDYDKAAEESKKAVQLDPTGLESHRARGIVLYYTQNLPEAVQEFQAALGVNKFIPDLNLYLGITYKALNEYGLAQEALLQAYALNPTDTVALTELSRAYFADGRYPQAAQYAEEAIKVEPENARLYGNLGTINYKAGDYAAAVAALALPVRGGTTKDGVTVEGIPLDYGKIEEYYWYYGFALARSNRCSEAIPVFQALLAGVPNDEIAVYNATEGLALCKGATSGLAAPTAAPEATPESAAP